MSGQDSRDSDNVSAFDYEGDPPGDDWPKHRPLNNPESPPYCEDARCKYRAVSYVLDGGVFWAACRAHGGIEIPRGLVPEDEP